MSKLLGAPGSGLTWRAVGLACEPQTKRATIRLIARRGLVPGTVRREGRMPSQSRFHGYLLANME